MRDRIEQEGRVYSSPAAGSPPLTLDVPPSASLRGNAALHGETYMNTSQRYILVIAALVVVILCVYVPWIAGTMEHPKAHAIGYAPIWAPPEWGMAAVSIDFQRILVELIATMVVGFSAYFISGSLKPRSSHHGDTRPAA